MPNNAGGPCHLVRSKRERRRLMQFDGNFCPSQSYGNMLFKEDETALLLTTPQPHHTKFSFHIGFMPNQ
jgi:hypothetical protein